MVVPEVSEFYRPTYSSLNLGISAFTRSNSRRLMPISFAACSRVTRSTRGPSSWPRNSLITVLCKGPRGKRQGKWRTQCGKSLRHDEIHHFHLFTSRTIGYNPKQKVRDGYFRTQILCSAALQVQGRLLALRDKKGIQSGQKTPCLSRKFEK